MITQLIIFTSPALLFGGSCSIVFAEDVPNGIASETNAGELTNDGLQRLEDGSVISNEHTSKWRIFTDNGRDFFLQVSTLLLVLTTNWASVCPISLLDPILG